MCLHYYSYVAAQTTDLKNPTLGAWSLKPHSLYRFMRPRAYPFCTSWNQGDPSQNLIIFWGRMPLAKITCPRFKIDCSMKSRLCFHGKPYQDTLPPPTLIFASHNITRYWRQTHQSATLLNLPLVSSWRQTHQYQQLEHLTKEKIVCNQPAPRNRSTPPTMLIGLSLREYQIVLLQEDVSQRVHTVHGVPWIVQGFGLLSIGVKGSRGPGILTSFDGSYTL